MEWKFRVFLAHLWLHKVMRMCSVKLLTTWFAFEIFAKPHICHYDEFDDHILHLNNKQTHTPAQAQRRTALSAKRNPSACFYFNMPLFERRKMMLNRWHFRTRPPQRETMEKSNSFRTLTCERLWIFKWFGIKTWTFKRTSHRERNEWIFDS